jgi:hypothetical protein
MKKFLALVSIICFCCAFIQPGFAADNSGAYEKLFSAETEASEIEAMFAKSFLKVVPVEKICEISKVYTSTLGSFKQADSSSSPIKLIFENGHCLSTIGFDSQGKINTLWFGAPELQKDSLAEVLKLFEELEDQVSICLTRNDKEVLIDKLSEKPLAIGSAFKLFILEALVAQIKAGERRWSDIIRIENEWKSFPSGILQEWPAGSQLTLESVANLMISLSDNTATDHLFNLIGREELRRYFPKTCNPPFNTFEMFKLKIFFPAEGEKFIKGGQKEKEKILNDLGAISTCQIASSSIIYGWKTPKMIDSLEWHITTRELCRTIFKLKNCKAIQINPATGLVDKKDWNLVGFKGGSEPGVLNYTWVLQRKNDPDFYCLSCTANNSEKEVDSSKFNVAVARLLKLVQAKNLDAH